MTGLILKRANASRPSGQWRDDDYDVLEHGIVATCEAAMAAFAKSRRQ
jgi:hypothetical protein